MTQHAQEPRVAWPGRWILMTMNEWIYSSDPATILGCYNVRAAADGVDTRTWDKSPETVLQLSVFFLLGHMRVSQFVITQESRVYTFGVCSFCPCTRIASMQSTTDAAHTHRDYASPDSSHNSRCVVECCIILASCISQPGVVVEFHEFGS